MMRKDNIFGKYGYKNIFLSILYICIILSSSNGIEALPTPTPVVGNLDGIENPGKIDEFEIEVSAFEAGSNFQDLVTEEYAELDKERGIFGAVLATDQDEEFDIIIEVNIKSLMYKYRGEARSFNISASNSVNLSVDLERKLRILPDQEEEEKEDTSGTGGGSSGAPVRDDGEDDVDDTDFGDTRRPDIPPLSGKIANETLEEIRRSYQESEDIFAPLWEERLRQIEAQTDDGVEEVRSVLWDILLIISLLVMMIIAVIIYNIRRGKRKKEKTSKKSQIIILTILFITNAGIAYGAPQPQSVQGDVVGPDKFDAQWNITFYDPDSGIIVDDGEGRIGSSSGTTQDSTPHPFYADAITLESDNVDDYYVEVFVENGISYGFNETPGPISHAESGLVLNIIMKAPLDINFPNDMSYLDNGTFDLNWSYPNNAWILFDVEIDDNPDFSSPIRSWELNQTSYDMLESEDLEDGSYYMRVRSKDVSDSNNHIYIDEETIEFVVDTVSPNIIDNDPANETWHNSDITFSLDTNEDATCRIDTNPGTPYSSKPYTMSGVDSTTHMFTTSFTSNGQYDYYIQCMDLAENIMPVDFHLRYLFDDVSPVTDDNYTRNDTWTKEDASIQLTATDASPSSGIEWTRYCQGEGCNPSGGTDYASSINLLEGLHHLRYATQDNAGNLESTKELIVKIDQTAPTTSHNYTQNDTWTDEVAEIELEANDPEPGSGVDWLRYCTGEGCTPDQNYTSTITINNEGTTHLRYHSNDNLNNTENVKELIIKIDQTGPLCDSAYTVIDEDDNISGESYATNTTLDFTFDNFNDNLSGISRYHYGFEYTGDKSNPTTALEAMLEDSEQGEVHVYVWAEDNVGNFGCPVNDSIIVDTVPPNFIDFENNNITSNSEEDLSVNATIVDNITEVDGVPSIRYKYGGESWSGYYDMNDIGGNKFSFDIPEYGDGWFNFRTQNIHWEMNVTDILKNKNISPLQSEYVDAINYKPYFEPVIENQSVEALGDPLQFWIDAVDPNNDGIENQELTFSSNVSNISITKYNNSRALVEWAPDNSWTRNRQDTNNTINFTISDDGEPSMSGWQLVDIQVNFTVEPPILDPIGDLEVDENSILNHEVEANDPNDFELTFYDNSTLFDIDPVTGDINYEPDWTEVGEYDINITVGNFEYNVSEVITLEVVNVENNVTFFARDRILEEPLENVSLYGGDTCTEGCVFDDNIRIVEPVGTYDYTFVKPGFENYTINDFQVEEDTNHTFYIDDIEPPKTQDDYVILGYNMLENGNFIVNSSVLGEDNFFLDRATMDYVRYDSKGENVLDDENIVLSYNETSDQEKIFDIDLGPYSSSLLINGSLKISDLYNNSITLPIVRTHFIYESDVMLTVYPPIVEDIPTLYAVTGEMFEYQVDAYDHMDRDVSYSDDSSLFSIDEDSGDIIFTPGTADEGTHNTTISVSNPDTEVNESFDLIIEEGKEITFEVRDDLINLPIEGVVLKGGRECEKGCNFDESITVTETSDLSEYVFSAPGFKNMSLSFSATQDETIDIHLEDIEPPSTQNINMSGRISDDELANEFFIDISADIADNVGVNLVDFEYEIIDSDEDSLIGETGSTELVEDNGLFNGTIGPFDSTVYIESKQVLSDYYGNTAEDENAMRQFMFESGELTSPHVVITKNTEYLGQELYNVTYKISSTIHNTAGTDIENLQFIDTDINNSFQYFNISKEESITLEREKVFDKEATSGYVEMTEAAASIFGKDFYSNAPTILVPGFGGPFDIILDTNETYDTDEALKFEIYLENMNPDYGQDAIVTYWSETGEGEVLDLRQESLFVQASSSLEVGRELNSIDMDTGEGQYFLKANLTWTQGQQAFATRSFMISQGDPTCYDGIQNQGETDVDCGGPNCPSCQDGLICETGDDCQSNRCISGYCFPATCNDGIKNQDETDVDCGGPNCDSCETGELCEQDTDCNSGSCNNNICAPYQDHCTDNVKNQGETDVDCGGPSCSACDSGNVCEENSDCISQNCALEVCMPATCSDGIQNQGEEDVDCGGPCGTCLFEVDRTMEQQEESYEISPFGETRILTDGDPSHISLSTYLDSNSVTYGEEVPETTIIRNNGLKKHNITLRKRIPDAFSVIPGEDTSVQKDDGNTYIQWTGVIRSKESKRLDYHVAYDEKYRMFFEYEEPNLKIYNKTFIAANYIRIFEKQKLSESLDVNKRVSYGRGENNISVSLEFRNTGELALENLSAKEELGENGFGDFWRQNDGQLDVEKINPGESVEFYYQTANHNEITSMPVVLGIEPHQVKSSLIIDNRLSIHTITYMSIRSTLLLVVLVLIIVYLYNLNIRKNKEKMNIYNASYKAMNDTKKVISDGFNLLKTKIKYRARGIKKKVKAWMIIQKH